MPDSSRKIVRHFREILIWPLQLQPIGRSAQIQEPWELLMQRGAHNPWTISGDHFSCGPEQFEQCHYSEFVTFLPYVRSFLYGEGRADDLARVMESPIRLFRRTDVAKVRMTFPGADAEAVVLDVSRVDLCLFYDIDVAILVVEICGRNMPLDRFEDTMYRFGRAYPTYWRDDSIGGHCLARAEWLDAAGTVLAQSDYGDRDKFLNFVGTHRAPYFASHWRFLLTPMVPDQSEEKGLLRYRQIEYSRMPLLGYLAMEDVRSLSRADFVRLGLVTAPGASDALPYSEQYVRDFEARYCYDQYWNEQRSGAPGARFMACGHAFVMVGDATTRFSCILTPDSSASSGTSTSCSF